MLFCVIETKLNIKESANRAVVGIVTASWVLNIIFSVLKILVLVFEKFRELMKSRTVLPAQKIEEEHNKTEIIIGDLELNKS